MRTSPDPPSRFARGGIIPGGKSDDDSIPVWLDNGYVIPKRAVDFMNLAMLSDMDAREGRQRIEPRPVTLASMDPGDVAEA